MPGRSPCQPATASAKGGDRGWPSRWQQPTSEPPSFLDVEIGKQWQGYSNPKLTVRRPPAPPLQEMAKVKKRKKKQQEARTALKKDVEDSRAGGPDMTAGVQAMLDDEFDDDQHNLTRENPHALQRQEQKAQANATTQHTLSTATDARAAPQDSTKLDEETDKQNLEASALFMIKQTHLSATSPSDATSAEAAAESPTGLPLTEEKGRTMLQKVWKVLTPQKKDSKDKRATKADVRKVRRDDSNRNEVARTSPLKAAWNKLKAFHGDNPGPNVTERTPNPVPSARRSISFNPALQGNIKASNLTERPGSQATWRWAAWRWRRHEALLALKEGVQASQATTAVTVVQEKLSGKLSEISTGKVEGTPPPPPNSPNLDEVYQKNDSLPEDTASTPLMGDYKGVLSHLLPQRPGRHAAWGWAAWRWRRQKDGVQASRATTADVQEKLSGKISGISAEKVEGTPPPPPNGPNLDEVCQDTTPAQSLSVPTLEDCKGHLSRGEYVDLNARVRSVERNCLAVVRLSAFTFKRERLWSSKTGTDEIPVEVQGDAVLADAPNTLEKLLSSISCLQTAAASVATALSVSPIFTDDFGTKAFENAPAAPATPPLSRCPLSEQPEGNGNGTKSAIARKSFVICHF